MLHRIWAEQSRSYKSWAIQLDPTRSTRSSGTGAGSTSSTSLEEYVAGLTAHLDRVQPSEVG